MHEPRLNLRRAENSKLFGNELTDFEKFLKKWSKLDAGGKPSTWLPPGRLVEPSEKTKQMHTHHMHGTEHEVQNNSIPFRPKKKRGVTNASAQHQ